MDNVLFACVHNAGRSQMAAAWLNQLCDRKKARAYQLARNPVSEFTPRLCRS
jgi:arsenate reductase